MHTNPHLHVGARPKADEIRNHSIPGDLVFTLLREEENARDIYHLCHTYGYQWRWLPLKALANGQRSTLESFLNAAMELDKELIEGKEVYLHCSQGIHRSGIVTFLYYRSVLDWSYEDAKDAVLRHRPMILQQGAAWNLTEIENEMAASTRVEFAAPMRELN